MSEQEDYEDIVDEAEDQMDDNQEMNENQLDSYDSGAYSVPKERSDMFNFFWKVARLMKPTSLVRVGNLSKTEVGEHGISVRDSMNLANLGDIFHHKQFGNYWRGRAMTTSETSMARDGWFMETTISQKKVRARAKTSSAPFEKSRIFGRKKQQDNQGQQA